MLPETTMPSLLYLNPRHLEPDDENVRRNPGDLASLADSLRRHGVLQPLGVAPVQAAGGATSYRVVYGNRRREAAILAGLPTVPCIPVAPSAGSDHLVAQLLENMQRRDLNDMEKAEGLARLRRHIATELGTGARAEAIDGRVSEAVGLAPRTVRRYLALRELPPAVRDLLSEERLSVTLAQHLAQLPTPALQEQVAARAVEDDWTAAQVSRVCAALARSPGLTVDQAAGTAQTGWDAVERLGPAPEPRVIAEAVEVKLPHTPRRTAEDTAGDADLWLDDATGAPTPEALGELDPFAAPATPGGWANASETADGHRVFRIRTLAAFCDEVDRLARCIQDGDLAKAIKADPSAPTRLSLAAKQLAFALNAVQNMA
jgi:ParB family transcriptional regulator, chromosome partitioning protein